MAKNMLTYKGYRAHIYYDFDDRIFCGEVLGIRDVLGFHAETAEELPKHFEDCIENYLDLCREIGKTPEREYTGNFNVRIAPEEHRTASLCAACMHISLNQYVAEAVRDFNSRHASELAL